MQRLLKTFGSILFELYVWSSNFKVSFHLILQILYLHYQGQLLGVESKDKRNILRGKVDYLYELMKNYGAAYRDSGGTGVFLMAIFLALQLSFWILDRKKSRRLIEQNSTHSFILFLLDPASAKKEVQSTINNLIVDAINSNANYALSVATTSTNFPCKKNNPSGAMSKKDAMLERVRRRQRKTIERYTDQISKGELGRGMRRGDWLAQTFLDKQRITLSGFEGAEHQREVACLNEIARKSCQERSNSVDLQQQSAYLSSVLKRGDDSCLWPPNRRHESGKSLKQIWFGAYLLLVGLGTFSALLALIVFHNLCAPKPTLLDQLSLLDEFFILFFFLDACLTHLVLLLVRVVDQLRLMRHLSARFDSLFQSYKQLGMLKGLFVLRNDAAALIEATYHKTSRRISYGESTATEWRENLEERLKRKCDESSISLYIALRMFIADAKMSIDWTRYIMNQRAWFFLFILCPSALTMNQVLPDLKLATLIAALSVILGINFSFYICASLHTSSRHLTKKIWTLLAISLEATDCESPIKAQSNWLSLMPPRNSITSLHMMLLWQRLVADHQLISDYFLIKVLGIFRIDTNGLVRVNFWIISVVIIFFTYKAQSI